MSKPVQYGNVPSLASLLELHKKNTMAQINCHQVGEIVSFNPSTQTAEVQVKMTLVRNGEIMSYPLLIDCPCVVLGGGKGRVTFPISAGDSCLVLFNDRDIDNWYSGGQSMPPRTDRNHAFSDAIALVGIRNKQNQIEDYLQHGVELKYGKSTIKLENNKVTITNNKSTITMDKDDITINGNVNVIQNTIDDNSLHAYVISSYHNGTDWYRVWSDGWCEQGGDLILGTTSYAFIKTYSSIPRVFLQACSTSNAGATNAGAWLLNALPTNSGFTLGGFSSSYYNGGYWEAKGYIS